jgi:SAM-dependent methyltransferase
MMDDEPGRVADRAYELNQAFWNERVPLHVRSAFYDVDGFRRRPDALRPFEQVEVGEVAGRTLLHAQCHFGLDTLSWAGRGARVTGLDFAPAATAAARALAAELAIAAEFVTADVYDAVAALGGRTFDIVYTGFGALVWLPDIERWAETMARLVRPGGFLYLAEFHPFATIFEEDDGRHVELDYFSSRALVETAPGSYADPTAETRANTVVSWIHPIGEVVSAIAAAGLRVEFLHEHDVSLFPMYPAMRRGPDGYYRAPEGRPRVPLAYTVRASRPV